MFIYSGEHLGSDLLSSSHASGNGGVHHSSQYSQPLREVDFLQELLSSASNLSFAPRTEEKFLQVILKQAKELVNEMKGLFTMTTISPLLIADHQAKAEEVLVMDRLKIFPEINVFDMEDILSSKWKLPSKKRLLDIAYVISLPPSALFERVGSHEVCEITLHDEQVISTAWENYTQGNFFSATLTYLTDLLQASNASPLRMLETRYLQACVVSAQKLEEQLEMIVKVFHSTQSNSNFTNNLSFAAKKDKKRLSWSLLMQLVKIVVEYPLQLSQGVAFLTCLTQAISWRKKVMFYADDNHKSAVENSAAIIGDENLTLVEQEERRTSRAKNPSSKSTKSSSSNTSVVKLSDVELLMKEGELFPLRFDKEFLLLHKKKEQALEWIHRFKQLFAGGSNKRSRDVTDDDGHSHHVSHGKKMNVTLEELKEMMAAGEASLEQPPAASSSDPQAAPSDPTITTTTAVATSARVRNSNKASRGTSIQRELGKAMSAIEEAEDWILRFKEISSTLFVKVVKGQDIDEEEEEDDMNGDGHKEKEIKAPPSRQRRQTQRLLAIRQLKSFLSEANDLPVIIAEAEILKLQVAALEWAQKVDFSLLSLPEEKEEKAEVKVDESHEMEVDEENATYFDEKNEGKIEAKPKEKKTEKVSKKLRLIEFNNLRHEILRIRHEMTSSMPTSDSQVLDELPEENQFFIMAESIDLLLKRLKSCHTAKDIKANVDNDKLTDLINQAKNMPVNLENETKIIRSAIEKVDTFMTENKSTLIALQLLPGPPEAAVEGQEMEVSPSSTTLPTMSELEALRDIALTITVDFQLKQQLILLAQKSRLWKMKFAFVKSTLETLQHSLHYRVLTPEEASLLLTTKTRKSQVTSAAAAASSKTAKVAVDMTSFMISPSSLDTLLSEASMLKVDFNDDTKLVSLLRKFLQHWEMEVDTFIQSRAMPFVEKLFTSLQGVLLGKEATYEVIFPFLQSLLSQQTLAKDNESKVKMIFEDLFFQLDEIINASVKLTEVQKLSQLHQLSSLSLMVVLEGILKRVQGFVDVATPSDMSKTENFRWADVDPEQVEKLQEEVFLMYRMLSRQEEVSVQGQEQPKDLLESVQVLKLCLDDRAVNEFAAVGRPRVTSTMNATAGSSTAVVVKAEGDDNQNEQQGELPGDEIQDDQGDNDGEDGEGDNHQADEDQGQEQQGEEEIGGAVKGTRSSSGISKKRSAAEAFALPVSAPNAASTSASGKVAAKTKASAKGGGRWPNKSATAAASANKRRRADDATTAFAYESTSAGATAADAFESDPNNVMDVVDDLLEPVFESAAMLDPLTLLSSLCSSNEHEHFLQGTREKVTPLLSLMIQVMTALHHRLYEAQQWKDAMKRLEHSRLTNNANTLQMSASNRNEKRQRLLSHLDAAETRGIKTALMIDARKKVEFFDTWIATVSDLLQNRLQDEDAAGQAAATTAASTVTKNKKVISLDELRDLTKQGESSIFTSDLQLELTLLRNEAKKVKTWKTKLDALRSLDASSTRALELQQSLVSEASELLVDVNEEVEALKQESTCYCLCRQLYFGEMVGCDHCDEVRVFILLSLLALCGHLASVLVVSYRMCKHLRIHSGQD